MPILNWIAVAAAVLLTAFIGFFSHDTPSQLRELPSPTVLATVPNSVTFPVVFNPLAVSSTSPGVVDKTSQTTSQASTTLNLNQTILIPKTQPFSVTSTSQAGAPILATGTVTRPESGPVSAAVVNTSVGIARGAIVNIICIPKGSALHSASASGVVIDSRGIILTVAHMAQYFLLKDYPEPGSVSCVIRTGSPAENAYTASLAYISPKWLKANDSTLIEDAPTGTGENDFALLVIDGSASDKALPDTFTAVPLAAASPEKGDPVTIASYGAEFLSSSQIRTALYPIVVFGSIGSRFTFETSTVDLVEVDGTAAAQEGSSGGAIINADNQLTGLITTSSSGIISSRDLHAITPLHIRDSFKSDMRESLDSYLTSHSPAELIEAFKDEAASLSARLAKAVD